MSEPTTEELQAWLDAVDGFDDTSAIEQAVLRVGKFMKELGQLTSDEVCKCISEIDFTMPATVVRLPGSAYVQYCGDGESYWFTDTGYGAQAISQGGRLRKRKVYTPRTVTPALKVSAIDIEDLCAIQDLFVNLSPAVKQKIGQPQRGAGTQYLVFNRRLMKEI